MRLQQIADEVTRIAAALAEAGTHPRRFAGGATTSALPEIAVDDVRAILRLRRKRDALFGAGVFADPAWDMLLDLTAARLESVEIPVSSLCLAAAVPATTALRWMRTLFDLGLIERRADPDDKRRIHIVLTEPAYAAMRELLGEAKRAGLAAL
jgi:DNA-binding transcriptional ArsR family regulator